MAGRDPARFGCHTRRRSHFLGAPRNTSGDLHLTEEARKKRKNMSGDQRKKHDKALKAAEASKANGLPPRCVMVVLSWR